MILPMIPAQTTMTAVSPGIPPLLPASSIAIGVVTDFGASEAMSELFTPRRCPTPMIEPIPTIAPMVIATMIEIAFFFRCATCS